MKKVTLADVVDKNVGSVPRATVMEWLKMAGFTYTDVGGSKTRISLVRNGVPSSVHIPVDLDPINGNQLWDIAKACQEAIAITGSYKAADDLPNWVAPILEGTPFEATLTDNHLVVKAKNYPEFTSSFNIARDEGAFSSHIKAMGKQLASYQSKLSSAAAQGWVRQFTHGAASLRPPAGYVGEPVPLTGTITELFNAATLVGMPDFMDSQPALFDAAPAEHVTPTPAPPVREAAKQPPSAKSVDAPAAARSERAFRIADTCPPAQRRIFEGINKQLEIFGISTADVDLQYRLCLMTACLNMAAAPGAVFVHELKDSLQANLLRTEKRARKYQATYNLYQYEDHLTKETRVIPHTAPSTIEECNTILDELENTRATRVQGMANSLVAEIGRFQDMDPEKLAPNERKIYDAFNEIVHGQARSALPSPASTNMMQHFADGHPLYLKNLETLGWLEPSSVISAQNAAGQPLVRLTEAVVKAIDKLKLPRELVLSAEPSAAMTDILDAMTSQFKELAAPAAAKWDEETHNRNAKPEKTYVPDPWNAKNVPLEDYSHHSVQYFIPQAAAGELAPMSASVLQKPVKPDAMDTLYLTPACIHRAHMMGVFKLVTHSEALQELRDKEGAAEGPASLDKAIMAVGAREGVSKEQFLASLDEAAGVIKAQGRQYINAHNNLRLDMERYYADIREHAQQWTQAISAQSATVAADISTRAQAAKLSPVSLAAIVKETDQKFQARYANLDPASRAVIARYGIRFMVDPLRESGKNLSMTYDQGVVVFTPEFLNRPNAMQELCDAALRISIQRMDSTQALRDLANEEMDSVFFSKLPKTWTQNEQASDAYVLSMARREPAEFRRLLPINFMMEHAQAAHVAAEGARILTGAAPEPQYQATDTAFTVNTKALSAPQQAYFQKLNEIIAMLGMTPKQFDTQFRMSCDLILTGCVNEPSQGKHSLALDAEKSLTHSVLLADRLFGVAAPAYAPNMVETGVIKWTADWENGHDAQDNYQHMRDLARKRSPDSIVPMHANVLQSYAAGERPLGLLSSISVLDFLVDKQRVLSKGDDLFESALEVSINLVASARGLDPETSGAPLVKKIQELELLSKQACRWPTPFEMASAPAPRTVPPAVAAKLEEAKAAQLQRARAEEERRAAIEAARPAPYVLDTAEGTVAGRIQRQSEKGDRHAAAVRMRYLQADEIKPLQSLLNTKLPLHGELGDVFLSEAVLRRAEYACLPVPEKDKGAPALNGVTPKAQALFAALANVKPEELPEDQRTTYLAMRDRMLRSPTLVIATLGNDQQLKELRAIHDRLLPNPLLSKVEQLTRAQVAALEHERATLAHGLLVAHGIAVAPPPAPELAAPVNETPVNLVLGPVTALALAGGADVAEPEERDFHMTPMETPLPAVAPAEPAPAPAGREGQPTFYEEWRVEQKQLANYKEAEGLALSNVPYITDKYIVQDDFRELECRLKSYKSGYKIQMTFWKNDPTGKNRKVSQTEMLDLKGVTHIDDAMDIFLAVEDQIFSEHPQFVVDASGKSVEQAHYVTPAHGMLPKAAGKPTRARVEVIHVQRNENNISHSVLDLKPADILAVDDPNFMAEPPRKRGAATEARIVKTGDTATLVIHSWFAKDRNNKRLCSQVNIPLGVDAAQREEARDRANRALRIMQNAFIDAKPMTPQEVINALQKEVKQQPEKNWVYPKTHYVPNFETDTELNFPSEHHKQSTRLGSASLSLDHSAKVGPHYTLQFRFKVSDNSNKDGPAWYVISGRQVNLHTTNPQLAEARGAQIMESVQELFNTTLTNGQDKKGGVLIPPDWSWDLTNARPGEEYIKRASLTHAQRAKVRTEGITIDRPAVGADNLIDIVNYAIGSYADDLGVSVGHVTRGDGKTTFTLQLQRGTRDADTLAGKAETMPQPEPFSMAARGKKDTFLPVEVPMSIDHNGRTPQQIDQEIEKYRRAVESSTKSWAWLEYRSTVTTGDHEVIKGQRKKYDGATVVNGFTDAAISNLGRTAGTDSNAGFGVISTALNDDMRGRVVEAMNRSNVSPRINRASGQNGGHDGR
ncbi:MAG: hypothetical protein V4735_08450 [Pseudomonadota bacterium]